MSANNDEFVPLDKWPLLERDRVRHAVDLTIQMLEEGRVEPSLVILKALSNRLAVDDSVEQYWIQHEELEGRDCYGLHN